MQHIFMNNFQLCSEINERVVQHFVHCIETHGRNVQYLKFLQTIVKAENKFIKKCQDIVMAEVVPHFCTVPFHTSYQSYQFCPNGIFLFFIFPCSWWMLEKMFWSSTTIAHPSRLWCRWCGQSGIAWMRTVHWCTTYTWWSFWPSALRARTSTRR